MRGSIPGYLRPHVERIEAYRREISLDLYLRSSGERTVGDRTIHGRYPELNDGRLFQTALEAGDLTYARALLSMFITSRLVDANDHLVAARLGTVVTYDGGEKVPIGRALAAWRAASTDDERRRIGTALVPGLEQLAAAQRQWLDEYGSIRAALRFRTQSELVSAVYGDVRAWLRHAETYLASTRDGFLREAAEWQRRDGRGRTTTFTAFPIRGVPLPAGAVASDSAVRRTAATWGFGAEAQRIPIDLVPRPGKLAGALCGRIDPPRDVRVTSQPTGDSFEYVLLLHEFGHGLHFTVGPDRPFDLFGDDQAITEGFGITFGTVASEPGWLREFAGVTFDDESLARMRFGDMLSARLQAIHVLYEYKVFSGAIDYEKEFVEIYRRETGIEISPHLALTRMLFFLGLQPFYALALYQAYGFRDALWQRLTEVGGPTWYANGRCHPLLADLFRTACERDLTGMFGTLNAPMPTASAPR